VRGNWREKGDKERVRERERVIERKRDGERERERERETSAVCAPRDTEIGTYLSSSLSADGLSLFSFFSADKKNFI